MPRLHLLLLVWLALAAPLSWAQGPDDVAAPSNPNVDAVSISNDLADINPAVAGTSVDPASFGSSQYCSAWTFNAAMQADAVADRSLNLKTAPTAGIPFASLTTINREGKPCGIGIGICGKVRSHCYTLVARTVEKFICPTRFLLKRACTEAIFLIAHV